MITIVNYGLGNLGSIKNMLKRIGVESHISSDPKDLSQASKIILPGVGAFDTGMQHLMDNGWLETLNKKVLDEKLPTLGICLGMQLMTKRSEEGNLHGLGWIDAEVLRFNRQNLRVPHMGWNIVKPASKNSILGDDQNELRFYFVHSYFVKLDQMADLLGTSPYGEDFASAFRKDNIYGVQFHPEKSHRYGMNLLKNFSLL